MTVRNIEKSLACTEDLALGVGTVQQKRGTVHRINVFPSSYSYVDMQQYEGGDFFRLYGSDTFYTDYRRNPAGTVGIPAGAGGVWEPIRSSDRAVGGNFTDGAYLVDVESVAWHAGTTSYYSWTGAFPHEVMPDTDPAVVSGYALRTDVVLREQLKASGVLGFVSYAAVRSYTGSAVRLRCSGAESVGDGGEGEFFLDTADTTTPDDSGTCLVDLVGRRWKRFIVGPVRVEWFIPLVVTRTNINDKATWDFAPALSAAHTKAVSLAGREVTCREPKIGLSSFTIDTNKVKVAFYGTDVWALTAESLGTIRFSQSEPDINMRPSLNRKNPLSGFRLLRATATGVAIHMQENHAPFGLTSVIIEQFAISGFDKKLVLADGVFHCTFRDFDFAGTYSSNISVSIPAGTNSGENNSFYAGRFGAADVADIVQDNGNASTNLYGCSFNYSKSFVKCSAGTVNIFGGHAEGNERGDYKFAATGAGLINVQSQDQLITSNITTAWGLSEDANTEGLHFKQCRMGNTTQTSATKLVDGKGAQTLEFVPYAISGQFMPSDANNMLSDPDFSAGNLSRWVVSGDVAWDGTAGRLAVGSAKFNITGPSAISMTRSVPCRPGERAHVGCWAYSTTTNTGNIYGVVKFLDSSGNQLAEYAFLNLTTGTGGQWYPARLLTPPAPIGTATVSIAISTFNFTLSATVYVDECNLSIL